MDTNDSMLEQVLGLCESLAALTRAAVGAPPAPRPSEEAAEAWPSLFATPRVETAVVA